MGVIFSLPSFWGAEKIVFLEWVLFPTVLILLRGFIIEGEIHQNCFHWDSICLRVPVCDDPPFPKR